MNLFKKKECPAGMDEYQMTEYNFNLDFLRLQFGSWRLWVYDLRKHKEWKEMEYAYLICLGPLEILKYKLYVKEGTEVDMGYGEDN